MTKTLIAAAAALMIATPALAAGAGATQTVPLAGVNFSSQSDVGAFYDSVRRAAAAACDSYAGRGRPTVADRSCTNLTVAEVVRQLDRPVLTATHESRTLHQPQRQFASR